MPNFRMRRRLVMRRVSTAPAFMAIINFRGTSGYVTDGANQTYCLAEAFPVSRGGQTFGWDAGISGAVDRDNGVDPRFAGVNYLFSGTAVFSLTLPRTGTFNVNYAAGDSGGFAKDQGFVIKDNTTVLSTRASLVTTGTQFADIAGTVHATSAAWIANSAPAALTFATTSFKLEATVNATGGGIASLVITG